MGETIFGHNVAEERMRKDNMKPNWRVAVDHDFYSANPEAAKEKSKEIYDEMYDGMDEKRLKRAEGGDVEREEYAMGGVSKVRKGFMS